MVKKPSNDSCTASLTRILSAVNVQGIANLNTETINNDLEYINRILHTNPLQSVLLACILESSFTRTGTTVKQICNLLKCSNIEFLKYSNELDALIKRKMIKQNITLGPFSESNGYVVAPEVIEAIKIDEPYVEEPSTGLTPEKLFERIARLFIECDNNQLRVEELKISLEDLVQNNSHLSFCKALSEYDFSTCENVEFLLFMSLCNNYVNLGSDFVSKDSILSFMGTMSNLRTTYASIRNGRLMVQQKGLVEFGNDSGLADTNSFYLTDLAKEKFFRDFDIELDIRKTSPDIIRCDSIVARTLYYNAPEFEQIQRLTDILEDGHFKEIQSRLEDASMRKGFNCLFYGAPGTGKTETVFQIAKGSGRDVLQIDISKLKSKWVGDSEKAVRSIFKYYQWLVAHSKVAPILLFNEADGIFGVRAKIAERSVDKMNNSIQNIILQEMENMEGILIATTNMIENLDSAFERRFLYKVEFTVPEASVRSIIWEAMMPFLSAEEAGYLAQHFSLSGGQIENVSRKCAVEYILSGKNPELADMGKMCELETIQGKKRPRIGF